MDRRTIRYPDGTVELKCSVNDAVMCLADYEDSWMTPESIIAAQKTLRCFDKIGIKRASEIVDAELEGRLTVLPCKVGDTVYIIVGTHIYKGNVTHWWIDESGLSVSCMYNSFGMCMHSGEIGKTVFLTHEEAAAALGGNKK